MNRHWREKRQCLSPAFFFILEKAVKSIGNAVIPTFPMHRSYGFQHLRHKRPRLLSPVKVGNTTRLSEKNRTQRLTRRNTGLPSLGHSTALCCQRNRHRKNSRRKWMHALRRVSAFFGVAAPPGCVIFLLLSKLEFVHPALRAFPRVRDTGGITTLGVLCMLPKCRTAACQSGLFVVFLRPLFTFVKAPAGHCQYPHRYRSPAAGSPADTLPALG